MLAGGPEGRYSEPRVGNETEKPVTDFAHQ